MPIGVRPHIFTGVFRPEAETHSTSLQRTCICNAWARKQRHRPNPIVAVRRPQPNTEQPQVFRPKSARLVLAASRSEQDPDGCLEYWIWCCLIGFAGAGLLAHVRVPTAIHPFPLPLPRWGSHFRGEHRPGTELDGPQMLHILPQGSVARRPWSEWSVFEQEARKLCIQRLRAGGGGRRCPPDGGRPEMWDGWMHKTGEDWRSPGPFFRWLLVPLGTGTGTGAPFSGKP